MKDIFFFDSMLTPKIIIFIYWLGLISVVIGAIGSIFISYGGGFWSGLGILLFGLIATRVWCELLIVLFKINEDLQKIANRQGSAGAAMLPPRFVQLRPATVQAVLMRSCQ
ncbi:DUF4282 domain-containing protein [Pseudomonas stutzeri]|uniref:DUF4282 domain-containing protein n=1 Tax=Stutzerimonas stutzeri TaxID=316 RepID=UPI001F5218E0|nr:DUF4282 domain-containing protein [Stutzerimonas stutzeri]MCI0917810.1 DUF4282 domain-containing protein [Stutzerimonas stutzeri]